MGLSLRRTGWLCGLQNCDQERRQPAHTHDRANGTCAHPVIFLGKVRKQLIDRVIITRLKPAAHKYHHGKGARNESRQLPPIQAQKADGSCGFAAIKGTDQDPKYHARPCLPTRNQISFQPGSEHEPDFAPSRSPSRAPVSR